MVRFTSLKTGVDCEGFFQAINFMERNKYLNRVTDNRAIELEQSRRRNGRCDSFWRIFLRLRLEKRGCVEVIIEARDAKDLRELEVTNADK